MAEAQTRRRAGVAARINLPVTQCSSPPRPVAWCVQTSYQESEAELRRREELEAKLAEKEKKKKKKKKKAKLFA